MKTKKILLSVLLIATVVPAAFAQLKAPHCRNLRNLENIITRGSMEYHPSFSMLEDPMLSGAPLKNSAAAVTTTQLSAQAAQTAPATHIPDVQLLKSNHSNIANMRVNHVFDDVWEAMDAPKVYTSQKMLAQNLADFYYEYPVARFRSRATQEIGEVYELPVEGIQYAPLGRSPVTIDAQTHVIFYIKSIGAQIIERKQLENPLYFEPVTAE